MPVKTEVDVMPRIAVFVQPTFTAQIVNLHSHQAFVLVEISIQINVEAGGHKGFVVFPMLSTIYLFRFIVLFRATFAET